MSEGGHWLRRTLIRVLGYGSLTLSGLWLLYITVLRVGKLVFFDFTGGLYNAGVAIVHGADPYRAEFLAHQAALMRAGHVVIGETSANTFSIPVYPAIANVLVVPFTVLPPLVAGAVYSLLGVAAMVGGLRLLGVRDWRCHLLALVSWPFVYGVFLGAVGPFLVLGLGVAWRWRDRVVRPAVAVAALVAVKVFPWTVAVWLLITRRYRAFALSAAAGLVLTLAAWAAIGFHGLLQYPQMLSDMSFIQEDRAVSVVGILVVAGVPSAVATLVALVLGGLVLLLAWRLSSGPDGDRRAFGLAILAALTATPIVWDHYMVLLFVPIALISPRMSATWLIPVSYPLINALSRFVPVEPGNHPFSPDLLRGSVTWVLLEILTGFVLCTTPEQRRALVRRVSRITGRRAVGPRPAGVVAETGS
jgi:hypothetical protein